MQSCLPSDSRHVYPVFKQLTTTAPIITQIDDLLLPDETSYLIQKANDAGFEASETGGHSGEGEVSSLRTSRTSFLPEDDPVVACVRKRLAVIANMPEGSLEPLQATHYSYGQQYESHHDDDAATGSRGHQRRLRTLFAYLGADGDLPTGKCGGGTRFDRLEQASGVPLRVYPAVGRALLWSNWDDTGRRDLRTHHGGEKVTCPGVEKIGLNAWFHGEKPRQTPGQSRALGLKTKHTARRQRGAPHRAVRSRSRK